MTMLARGNLRTIGLSLFLLTSGCGGKDDGTGGRGGAGPGGAAQGPGSTTLGGAAPSPGQGGAGTAGGSSGGSGAPTGATTGGQEVPFGTGGAATVPGLFDFDIIDVGGGNYPLGANCTTLFQRAGLSFGVNMHCPSGAPDTQAFIGEPCGTPCLRDTYVAAAILYCWAAACYGTSSGPCPLGDCTAAAEGAQECARVNLCSANDLCSDTPPVCNEPCGTDSLWECDVTTGTPESPVGGCADRTCPLAGNAIRTADNGAFAPSCSRARLVETLGDREGAESSARR